MTETVSPKPNLKGRAQQDSLPYLETLLPLHSDTVARAIAAGQVNTARFGMTADQALKALDANPNQLETIGVFAPALEAMVQLTGRPPLLIRDGKVVRQPLPELGADIDVKISAVEPFIPSVGRVELINHSMPWGGTGWVLSKEAGSCTVITNRHVAKLFARRKADGSGIFARSPYTQMLYGARIDFNEEVDALPEHERTAPVLAVTYLAEDLAADAALLKITLPAGAGWSLPDPIPLANAEAKVDERVAIIGYPAYDTRDDRSVDAIAALKRYFNDIYDVKRFSPGKLLHSAENGLVRYDCTTLGGNSGSPLISLESRAVVGLHFQGLYGRENTAVSVATIKALQKGRTTAGPPPAKGAQEAPDGVHQPADLQNRDGYDPDFLGAGLTAPWPKLPADLEAELARPSDATAARPHELRYTHFGVKFSAEKQLPAITAVNIDGEHAVHIKRGDDKWFFDARIPLDRQHGAKAYRDRQIDRGHMVRREDPNWGDVALQANFDTFHYPNSAPQHADLNQGKQLWQGLENYILNSVRTHGFKACVFTGPVFDPENEEIDGILVPLEFWKVVAMIDAATGKLHATGYLISQGRLIRALLENRNRAEAREGLTLGPYRTFQICIADLAEATGYDFGPLTQADPLNRVPAATESITTRRPIVLALETTNDIFLGSPA
ncbi:DNA/RNA non-specific endonuclease [Xanthobacteraceae bacterium A53D]